ncbi:Calcium-activated potassium channel subunit beta-3 [Acropora cervicornis]|uniref:Calcium-activated potassium channel subunit beta-3 n=1 Tax=Acropora cervicornis TaxID=6130 RepID=A0AAD9QUE3_ACRCE|nr:Calcium-activated potassium channel subunit beta-3 [Acropora cervicornis]
MLCNKAEGIFLLGIAIFLVGTVCLIAVEVCNVYPARQEQAFQAINCTIVDGNMEASEKCSNSKNGESYPCLRIHVACGKELKSDGKLQHKTPRLLSKDFHSLQLQCTYTPEQCMQRNQPKPHLLRLFQSGNPIGATVHCFYNPEDPRQVIAQKTSVKSYNKLVLKSMAWPLGIVVSGMVVVVTAGCVVSALRSRKGYEKIADFNTRLV